MSNFGTDFVPLDEQAEQLIREAEEFLRRQVDPLSEVEVAEPVQRDRSEWRKSDGRIERLGSEPDLRPDEVVCPVTGYTYFVGYHNAHGHSPYCEWDEATQTWKQAW